ncbi:MAG: putative ABC-type sugar transport system, permease component [Chloroflexi bacterium]|nr:putative ABC-type sugar transport system, permease component [Chloroflexota bacterium]
MSVTNQRRWQRHTRRSVEAGLGYFFVLPTLLLIALLLVGPLVKAFNSSLTNSSFINPVPQFVGWDNYVQIVHDPMFLQIVQTTAIWTMAVVIAQLVLGFATALLLNRTFRGRALVRALIIMPWVCPGVIAAIIWRVIDDPYLGPLDGLLAWLGVPHPNIAWLGQPQTALGGLVIAAIWKGTPFSTVMYLAALQSVPAELLEAATIDGAGAWARLRSVIIPQTMPVIRVILVFTIVWTFNSFDLIYVLTQGGPANSTQTFPTWIYKLAFSETDFGPASAYGMIALLLLMAFSLLYIWQLNRARILD